MHETRCEVSRETRKVLKRLGLYYVLMFINALFSTDVVPGNTSGIVPEVFKLQHLSSVYLLTLCVCLILYYSYRVSRQGGIKTMMLAISWMAFFLILIRSIKYSAFMETDIPARYAWYLYYVPILLIPLFLLAAALLVSEPGKLHIKRKWCLVPAITVVLILLVLTNDLHQMCFRFQPGMVNWEKDYSYGWVFYAAYAWQYALYLTVVVILTKKSRITTARKNARLTLIPFTVGTIMILLINLGAMPKINGRMLIQFPEAIALMVAGVLEVCIQLGLIPTNEKYVKILQISSIAAQITDKSGKQIYKSPTACNLTPEQFAAADGARISEHTVLHRMEVPGGYGFWQNDMTQLDELNRKLEEAKQRLSEEAELLELQNEIREEQAKIEHRTIVYDEIANRVQRQSQTISQLAEEARKSSDEALRDKNRKEIILLGAYIKRYANLTLIWAENKTVDAGEFALSLSEMLRYLNVYGIPGDITNIAEGNLAPNVATIAFEAFENLIEDNLSTLKGVTVRLSEQAKSITCKIILENPIVPLQMSMEDRLTREGIHTQTERENDITYLVFLLPKEGERL